MTSHPKNLQEETKQKMHKTANKLRSSLKPAFTIVELLIVVIVIAILATITMVAYNGITNNAKDSSLKADLNTAAKKVGLVNTETGSYPSTKPSDLPSTIQYTQTDSGQGFCATSSKDGKAFHITQEGTIQDGACPIPPIAANSSIQNVSSAQCQALPVYTGSNPTAIRIVTDTRGGTTRTYEIAKLADNKCWMLSNLKLGSTTGSITLTPSDSNVASSFTLPQVHTTGSTSTGTETGNGVDTPYAYGPVPGDTGSGATNYGYLYNWSAATAGATRTLNGAGSGNAANSICPANWRLPSGGLWNATTNELSNLNARMAGLTGVADAGYTGSNYYGATFYPNWQNTGPFKGVFSGLWWGSFNDQGSGAGLWSSSATASNANSAHYADFNASYIYPGHYGYFRYYGLGVRCLLN